MTNEPKFTPGPWLVSGDATVKKSTKDIAYVVRNGVPDFEVRSNTNLIAASPDLYAALEDALNGLRYWQPQTEKGFVEKDRICSAALAALAKARGE